MMELYNALCGKQTKLAVVGLGYVGLPIALAFAKHFAVIGFDIDEKKIKQLSEHSDPNKEVLRSAFDNCNIIFSSKVEALRDVSFFIIAVPTPVDNHNVPDISILLKACKIVGRALKKGDCVVIESTVYPGCTEEDCIPVFERASGLKAGTDFFLGYSPERINPGDKYHTLENVTKVVAGYDAKSLEVVAKVYSIIIQIGVYKVSSIKVAEAAKIIENTQRDLNIALMNELSIIFEKMQINTYEVLEAANTKWNFLNFSPGLVGGHCIGVDPYYLTYKAAAAGYTSKIITAGRLINDTMASHIAEKILQHIIANLTNVREGKILILGIAFKENIADIRNSKVAELVKLLHGYQLKVDVADVCCQSDYVQHEYGFPLVDAIGEDYDVVVVAVPHKQYKDLTEDYFTSITKPTALLVDVKGVYRNKISCIKYWSL